MMQMLQMLQMMLCDGGVARQRNGFAG